MSSRARLVMFGAGALGVALLLAWGLSGLADFGTYEVPYGNIIVRDELTQRRAWNAVAAVVFDYRGFDTLGEEYILFSAVIAVALLLRAHRDEHEEEPEDESDQRRAPATSDAVRMLGLGLVPPTVLFGLYVVSHGHLSPGGGFQGGVVLAVALLLVYLAGKFTAYERLGPEHLIEPAEASAAAAYALAGVGGLIFGAAFLDNFLPLGTAGDLLSAGTIPLINVAVGLEVAAAFVLLLDEFLEQAVLVRREPGSRRR